ncbi:GtrA family protein [Polaromonas sp.]|uniref:GtrA family protein n=1 Tax=Polaromonas sp. TaxID=1869339 RepID=UPI0032671487
MQKAMSESVRGRQLMAFVVVGTVGFAVDACLFFVFMRAFGIDILISRALAFLPATLVTWGANRLFTFRQPASSHAFLIQEYVKYLLVQAGGIAINFLVFYLMVLWFQTAAAYTFLPLATGSLAALLFNFFGARLLVFRQRSS